ncbi:MAG: hypothetical protein IKS07_10945 [Lachnospiraceae bacterium]|nr:hypothetical protein [Lachnospiraceae bacterium]
MKKTTAEKVHNAKGRAELLFWDIPVGILMLVLGLGVMVSRLPWKPFFGLLVCALGAFLLVRTDAVPGYVHLVRILRHFALPGQYERVYSDEMLRGKNRGTLHREFVESYGEKLKESGPDRERESAGLEVFRDRQMMDRIFAVTQLCGNRLEYGDRYQGAAFAVTPFEAACLPDKKLSRILEKGIGPLLDRIPEDLGACLLKQEVPLGERPGCVPVFTLFLFEESGEKLEELASFAQSCFREAGIGIRRLSLRELALTLRRLTQGSVSELDMREFREEDLYLWSMPESLRVNPRNLTAGDRSLRIGRMEALPEDRGAGWMAKLFALPGCEMVLKVRRADEGGYAVNLYALSEEDLSREAAGCGAHLRNLDYEQAAGFCAVQPSAYDPFLGRAHLLTRRDLEMSIPFGHTYADDAQGVAVGCWRGAPVRADFFRPASGVLIAGSAGGSTAGATALLRHLSGELSAQRRVIMLTAREHPEEIAGEKRARIVPAGNGRYVRINPFAFTGDFGAQFAFLEAFLSQLLPESREESLEMLCDAAERAYRKKGLDADAHPDKEPEAGFPGFGDLLEELSGDLKSQMAKYAEGGRHGALWNGERKLPAEDGLTVFSFYGILKGRSQGIGRAQFLLLLRELEGLLTPGCAVLVDQPEILMRRGDAGVCEALRHLAQALQAAGGSLILYVKDPGWISRSAGTARSFAALTGDFRTCFCLPQTEEELRCLEQLRERSGSFTEGERRQILALADHEALLMRGTQVRMKLELTWPEPGEEAGKPIS